MLDTPSSSSAALQIIPSKYLLSLPAVLCAISDAMQHSHTTNDLYLHDF